MASGEHGASQDLLAAGADGNGRPSRSVPLPAGPEFIELARVRRAAESEDPASARLRADAARNRDRVLAAADRLFARAGARAAEVTMQDIARAARVGRATLYRRYPTPAAVALALLDEHERRLQDELIRGAPPLGPGAPGAERLAAFYEAMIDLLERHLHLALGAETGRARFHTGAYRFWRVHMRTLLGPAAEETDAAVDALLAPLAPELYEFQRHQLGLSQAQIAATLQALARRFFQHPPEPPPAAHPPD